MWRLMLILCVCLVWGLGACDCSGPIQEPAREDAGSELGGEKTRDTNDTSDKVSETIAEEKTRDAACTPAELLDHTKWKQVDRADDPYKDLAPKKACDDVAFKLEDGVIEVETGICSFLTVSQTLNVDLHKGDTLKLIFWHGDKASV